MKIRRLCVGIKIIILHTFNYLNGACVRLAKKSILWLLTNSLTINGEEVENKKMGKVALKY